MGELKDIPFDQESGEIKDRVVNYWTKRADSFSKHKHEEMLSTKADLWRKEFEHLLPSGRLNILDVGCGTGFFEAVLAPAGHNLTGIDLTPRMIDRGRELMKQHGIDANLQVMDAERTDFPDECFDVIISRNLVWTLPHPIQAYREWQRLLKPHGTLLIFDAEYAKGFHRYNRSNDLAHKGVGEELTRECHAIYHMLTISNLDRPQWDAEVLKYLSFSDISVDLNVGDRIYAEKDAFYLPDRMFGIRAVK